MLLRNVCFTINNYSLEDVCTLAESVDGDRWSYLVIGYEAGSAGVPHIQGYGELAARTRQSTVAKKYLPRAHLEARKGSARQAAEYCMKENNYLTFGELSRQGARGDLVAVREMAKESGMRAVAACCNFQEIRVAEKFLTYCEEARDWKPMVVWLWGPTGTGKSRIARSLTGQDRYVKNTGTKWWDGYDGHSNVIMDDFRPSWWDLTYMLGLIDRYEFLVEFKGGNRQFRARTIVITSAFAPEECYTGTGECVRQLLRRIDVVDHVVPDVPEVGGVIMEPPDLSLASVVEELLGSL